MMKKAFLILISLLLSLPGLTALGLMATTAETPLSVAVPTYLPTAGWAKTGDIAIDGFPALTAEGFLPDGQEEYIFIDEDASVWRYASQMLRIVIKRTQIAEKKTKLCYLIAEIFVRDGQEGFSMVAHSPGNLMENRELFKEKPVNIAKNNGLVFSMDGDYYIYRVRRRQNTGSLYPVGIVIRDGQLLMDAPIRLGSEAYPPLDMLALFPGGDMQVFLANEVTADQLLQAGARDVLSFGPVLVRDGELGNFLDVKGATPQPRAGIGMFEPGHYMAIIAEGRIKQSTGLSSKEFGELFLAQGCQLAFNLDGGWTSAMVFMGKQLNQLDNTGVKNNARTQNEVMGIGATDFFEKAAP